MGLTGGMMTSSEHISRKARGGQMHKEFQRVRIPRRERIEIERGLREMDFARYYAMRHLGKIDPKSDNRIYIDPKTGDRHVMEDHNLPVMLSHGNLQMRIVEHEALMAILGREQPIDHESMHPGEKYCGGCHEWHPLNENVWGRNSKRKDGYQNWCKEYMNGYQATYRKKKREKAANPGK